MAERGAARIDLLWIPLGADGRVVRLSGAAYEAVVAALERRPRCRLFHTALEVEVDGRRWTIESTPVPDDRGRSARGVVGDGPVGVRALGRFRVFRYEIRCWEGGTIPDRDHAVAGPIRVDDDPVTARAVLELVPDVPTPVWGRDELGAGEMWNSNSLTSWALTRAGVDVGAVHPPPGGRAPGWDAGIAVASRSPD